MLGSVEVRKRPVKSRGKVLADRPKNLRYFNRNMSSPHTLMCAALHAMANSFVMLLNAPISTFLQPNRTQILLLASFRSSVAFASKRKTEAAAAVFRFAIVVYIGLVTNITC